MKYPKISILVPVYNRVRFLKETIESALHQTYQNIEIVIVDNNSDDGTWELCKEMSALHESVFVYRNSENVGPVRNWQRCAKEATGEYCKILFSDDTLEPDCIERMVQHLTPNISFVFSSAKVGRKRESSTIFYSTRKNLFTQKQYLRQVMREKLPVSPGAMLFRTEDVRSNIKTQFNTSTTRNFISHGAGPDVMLAILTLENDGHAYGIDEPLVFFRDHDGSLSCGERKQEVSEAYRSVFAYYAKEHYGPILYSEYIAFLWIKSKSKRTRTRSITSLTHEFENGMQWTPLILIFCISFLFEQRWRKLKKSARKRRAGA